MSANYINLLPGVPKIESPFFQEFFDPADPLYSTAKALREDGYAIIDFPEPEIDALAEQIKHDLRDTFDWEGWNAGGDGTRLQDAWKYNAAVRRIATNTKMQEMLGALYGRRAFPFQTLNFPVGTQQHYHTDSVHFSSMPERFMCGVWVALEDIGLDQGPLIYYPGSHAWPIYTNVHIGHRHSGSTDQTVFEPLWERLVEVHGVAPRRFGARKGQALIWTANLLHGGDRQHDRNKSRWSQVTHYYFEDCVYYTPLTSNEPAGEVYVRNPNNIMAETPVLSSYFGRPVLDELSESAFDAEAYLRFNPDVAAVGMNPFEHYVMYGKKEGRRWS